MERWTLGLDISTQSISATILDPAAGRVVTEHSIAYRDDRRTNGFGIAFDSLLVPPRAPGEADQPPLMFLAALDAVFADLTATGMDLGRLGAIAVSAQQHGHVYLTDEADATFADLAGAPADDDLVARFRRAFSYGTAPIWQTANTATQVAEIAAGAGGTAAVRELSGSDNPLRFTGAVIRRVAQEFPTAWDATARVHLLSSFLSGVLAGRADCPIDWGNGSGMTLMDYRRRDWSPELLEAVAAGLPGGAAGLRRRLPEVTSPLDVVGPVARYFVNRYGVAEDCVVTAGSGDNPQSKVMTGGDLLSLGTSFVLMVDTGTPVIDDNGFANAMYDGLGLPFVFACRTNGALVWEQLRRRFGIGDDWDACSRALADHRPGETIVTWQPFAESYPVAPAYDAPELEAAVRAGETFDRWYAAVVDSALVLTWAYAETFDPRWSGSDEPLAITGGPSGDDEIARRVAAIWRRPVIRVAAGGAATGSAVSAAAALQHAAAGGGERLETEALDRLRHQLIPPEPPIAPDPELVRAYHEEGAAAAIIADAERRAGGV